MLLVLLYGTAWQPPWFFVVPQTDIVIDVFKLCVLNMIIGFFPAALDLLIIIVSGDEVAVHDSYYNTAVADYAVTFVSTLNMVFCIAFVLSLALGVVGLIFNILIFTGHIPRILFKNKMSVEEYAERIRYA